LLFGVVVVVAPLSSCLRVLVAVDFWLSLLLANVARSLCTRLPSMEQLEPVFTEWPMTRVHDDWQIFLRGGFISFACITVKAIGPYRAVSMAWRDGTDSEAPSIFINGSCDIEALKTHLQYEPNRARVDRMVRISVRDHNIMDVVEFRKIAELQVLLQHLRMRETRGRRVGTLSDLLHRIVRSVGCPYLNVDLVKARMDFSEEEWMREIGVGIPYIQIAWRQGLYDSACVDEILHVVLAATEKAECVNVVGPACITE
jgi:hypothetical protein